MTKTFGKVTAVREVSFSLSGGEILGLIGPNGAGKSTLFDLISGMVRPDQGKVRFRGDDLTGATPELRSRRGIARAFQIPKPFESLTAFENVLVGCQFGAGLRGAAAGRRAREILDRLGLGARAETLGGDLRLLDRKRLELAKALATAPRLLMLDEISSGLTEREVSDVVTLVKGLRAPDLAIIWTEHIARALIEVVDRILVLQFGEVLMEGAPDAVLRSPAVREIYMGLDTHELA